VKKQDDNVLLSLFLTRFYIQELVSEITQHILNITSKHTIYVDLILRLKEWLDEDLNNRVIDIVTFNYDTLIESALEQMYKYNYYGNTVAPSIGIQNIGLYKPHGSIHWGRKIQYQDAPSTYYSYTDLLMHYKLYDLLDIVVVSENIYNKDIVKNHIPAISIPYKTKTTFDECSEEMRSSMIDVVKGADYIITFGWKGAESHFTEILKLNTKVKKVITISRSGKSNLIDIFPQCITSVKNQFSFYVGQTNELSKLLKELTVSG